ncbi:MAG TPA: hypothetical protein VJR87_03960 [Allosphingosinicella sp.]|nr:hypothetical protein [Allosphingosinicella sp.]
MKKLIGVAALCAASANLGACATVINGTSQPVEFDSDPKSANVELLTGLKCETPCEYSMKRGHDSRVTFTKAGYQPVTVNIQSRTGGGVAGNILAGGLIGGVVDASNGAANHLYPDPVFVRMVPEGSSERAMLLDKKGEVISSVDEYNAKVAADVNEGLQKQGYVAKSATPSQ